MLTTKDTVQTAHPSSLINTFFIHCLDSTIPIVATFKILRLASFCSWIGQFESYRVAQTPEDRYSHNVARLYISFGDYNEQHFISLLLATSRLASETFSLFQKLLCINSPKFFATNTNYMPWLFMDFVLFQYHSTLFGTTELLSPLFLWLVCHILTFSKYLIHSLHSISQQRFENCFC